MSYSAEILIKRKLDEASSTKRLILMRGLPGSGKSYRAKEIHANAAGSAAIFSTDDYWGKIITLILRGFIHICMKFGLRIL